MSFEAYGLIVGRGDIFNVGTDYSSSINIYKSPYDLMSEITSPNYFPPYLGDNEKTILIGDILFIQDKDLLTQVYTITSVNPVTLVILISGIPFDQDLNTGDNVNFNSVISNVMAANLINATQINTTQLITQNEYIQTGNDILTSSFPVSIQFGGCFDPPHTLNVWLSRFTRDLVGMARIIIPATNKPQHDTYAKTDFIVGNTLPIGYRPVDEIGSIQFGQNLIVGILANTSIQLKLFPNGNIDVYGAIAELTPFHQNGSGTAETGWQQMEMTYPVTT